MANIVILDNGAVTLNDLRHTYLTTLEVHLFKNNYTPAHDDDEFGLDYVEADFDGYAVQAQNFAAGAVDNLDGTATATANLVIWTPTGITTPNNIYGYYVTDPGDGNRVKYAQRFAGGPFSVGATLLQFAMFPVWTNASL